MLRAGRLSVGVSGVRSPPVMLLLVSPFMSFIVFLTHLGAPMFGAYIIVVSSFWSHPLIIMSFPFLSLAILFILKYIFLA